MAQLTANGSSMSVAAPRMCQVGLGTSALLVMGLVGCTDGTGPSASAYAAVSAGGYHTCALTLEGHAYCWGNNSFGQLGLRDTTPRLTPAGVYGALRFSTISTGEHHTCGVAVDGRAFCWGKNEVGQLGDGTTRDRLDPTWVARSLRFMTVTAGNGHTCGIAADGMTYCWGENRFGQLGDGTTMQRRAPTPVSGGMRYTLVSAGGLHTCATTSGGTVYCWGSNVFGQLGTGHVTHDAGPLPSAVSGELDAIGVSAGVHHTCVVTREELGYCWGRNFYGQVGDGSRVPRSEPTSVAAGSGFLSVSAGRWHSCGVATTGSTLCWGGNYYGQLGDGTWVEHRLAPGAVLGSTEYGTLDAGKEHTCALTDQGASHCWGENSDGQLGDGTTERRATPVVVGLRGG